MSNVAAENEKNLLMKSKIDITEFRNRLKANTKIGSPKLKLSPFGMFSMFGQNSKYFYGYFDNSTFQLTTNSNFFPTFFVLKGSYKVIDHKLKLTYIVEPSSKTHVIWMKYFPVIALIVFNCLSFFNSVKTPTDVYIIFNLFITFIFFYSRFDTKRKKKNLEEKFNKIFEIID